MIFETHAHYDDARYDEDREELLRQLPKAGISHVVNIGAGMQESRESIELSKKYDFIYATIGVHPENVARLTEADIEQLERWCDEEKVVAVGEIGLDYHYDEPEREIQKHWFIEQLELAYRKDMPIVVHSRDAAQDTIAVLREHHGEELSGIIHCFSYSKEMAMQFLDMGFDIGIGGVVTFKNAKKLVEAVEAIPLSRIVLETDCPYLAPTPHRGERNSSLYIPYIAEKIAEIKQVDVEEVYRQTMENAKRIYRL